MFSFPLTEGEIPVKNRYLEYPNTLTIAVLRLQNITDS